MNKKKLNSPYESFKYGIKTNNREKMDTAAKTARQILLHEADKDFNWSPSAARFCGSLLRRVNIYDHEVFLIGCHFYEAAYACWKNNNFALAGAYAVLAILEENPENIQDLFSILAVSSINTQDFSGISVLYHYMPDDFHSFMERLVREICSAQGLPDSNDISSAIASLTAQYPARDMSEELDFFELYFNDSPESFTCVSHSEAESQAEPNPEPSQKNMFSEIHYGSISRLNTLENTGIVSDENGKTYTFRVNDRTGDITDKKLYDAILSCYRSDLGGKHYYIKFSAKGTAAYDIQYDDQLVNRARAIAADSSVENRFEIAFSMCKKALDSSDFSRALGDLPTHAAALYNLDPKHYLPYVQEAISFYENNRSRYPNKPFALIKISQCYRYLKRYSEMISLGERALTFDYLVANQKITILADFLKGCRDYYEASGNKAILTKMLTEIHAVKDFYQKDFSSDQQITQLYKVHILPSVIFAECHMDLLDAAEADYAQLDEIHNESLDELMNETRARLFKKELSHPDHVKETYSAPETSPDTYPANTPVTEAIPSEEPEDLTEAEEVEEIFEEEPEEDIPPYTDPDGWDALKLTKQAVIDYALSITGSDPLPSILSYLRVGAALNDQISPVYRAVALAANDPMESPDYNITALSAALENSDPDYPLLCDYCMAAAFLRTSFLSGRGYDYSAQGLRDSISISHQLPVLRAVYDTLEQFRKETGRAIDIYADYRNHGVKKLMEDLDAVVTHANELYTKFILTPARESVSFARLIKTKEIVFDRSGYLAAMLQHIINRNQDALEEEKDNFVSKYLNSSDQFSANHISVTAVDDLIVSCWDQAGKELMLKKANATLQGDRRNNLRSNISDILRTICQWYSLSEQSAGLTWRTEKGEQTYRALCPELLEQLDQLSNECLTRMENTSDPQVRTGLFLLSSSAQELSARLNGSWKFEQEKYLYTDFLRTNHIMLSDDFMPELSSTFCVLPDFNVLARIRRHAEEEKLSFRDQIKRIYSTDKSCNNYGTAEKILDYLAAMDQLDSVDPPENAQEFVIHTEMQADIRYCSFLESYAQAVNYGQIIKSDPFCSTLEDTVKYWYSFCKKSKNFGFFTNIVIQATDQIHASAQQAGGTA